MTILVTVALAALATLGAFALLSVGVWIGAALMFSDVTTDGERWARKVNRRTLHQLTTTPERIDT